MSRTPPHDADAQVRRITARDNPLLVRLRKLGRDPAAYRASREVLLVGDHLCQALLARGKTAELALISDEAWLEPQRQALARRAERVVVLPARLLGELQPIESPTAIAFVVAHRPEEQVLTDAPTLILDRVQDAGNVGTLLRSAAAFGIVQVLALKGTAALWSPKVLRAGMGAHFALRLLEADAADAAIATLAVPLVATSSHAPDALSACALPWPCAWVVGHEGQGVAASVLQRCARTVRIPQPGGEESLNVAAAAAICLYESARQRGAA